MNCEPIGDVSYFFGPFEFIPDRYLLLRGAEPVRLGGRALDLLHLLLLRAGDVVSKRDLMDHAWPRLSVDGANLKVQLSNLRRALGDILRRPTYILTVIGRGYKFVGQVRARRMGTFVLGSGVLTPSTTHRPARVMPETAT